METKIYIDRQDVFERLKMSCKLADVIQGIITCKIVESTAADLDISVSIEELQNAADDFRQLKQLNSIQNTQIWLQKNYLSLDEFEHIIYINILSRKLVENLFSDQVESFFYKHHTEYAGAAIYEVCLDDEDIAMELFCALQEGEISLHEIARQYITEPSLRRSGGYRGIVSRRELPSEISSAVFAANPPQFIKPIVTSKGVHLILVEEIIQPQLNKQMRTRVLGELFSNWLARKKEELNVVLNLDLEEISSTNRKASENNLA